jgi:hypothetical protein
MWTEVSSSVPHFLQMGLLLSPIVCICLLKVLWPVSRPVTTLDCVLLKDSNRAHVTTLGPEINSRKRRGNICCEICAEPCVRGPVHCIGTDFGWPCEWKRSLVYWWVVEMKTGAQTFALHFSSNSLDSSRLLFEAMKYVLLQCAFISRFLFLNTFSNFRFQFLFLCQICDLNYTCIFLSWM